MATNKRTYPNDYFARYNDDTRLAIVTQDAASDSTERTSEKYDSFQGTGDLSGSFTASCSRTAITSETASVAHNLVTNDRVSISGTTNFNDADLSSQTVTLVDSDTFTMVRDGSSASSGETGTFTSLFINDGLRITYHAKYEKVDEITDDLQTGAGVDSGLHPAIVCFVKARLYEDQGDMEKSSYFRKMYDKMLMQYPSRRSGVRSLSVPHM